MDKGNSHRETDSSRTMIVAESFIKILNERARGDSRNKLLDHSMKADKLRFARKLEFGIYLNYRFSFVLILGEETNHYQLVEMKHGLIFLFIFTHSVTHQALSWAHLAARDFHRIRPFRCPRRPQSRPVRGPATSCYCPNRAASMRRLQHYPGSPCDHATTAPASSLSTWQC